MIHNFELIGVRIKQYREAKSLSQEELGEMISISNRHLSKVETGTKNPSLNLIIDVANALGVTPDNLLGDYLDVKNKAENSEILEVLADCSETKTAMLMKLLKYMKQLLSEYGI